MYGNDAAMFIYLSPDYEPLDQGLPLNEQTIFYNESSTVQKAVLTDYKTLWPMLGFQDPLKSFYCYGFSNANIAIAQSCGYNIIGALCADENWQDGQHQFNHWGMPARPYFVASDDFRKTANGGSGGVVGMQQCERQTDESRDYNCVYSFESGVENTFLDPACGITWARKVNDASQTRVEDMLQCFLNAAGQTDYPHFFSCGLEWDAAHKAQLLDYFVQEARSYHLTFVTPSAAAEFYRRHYKATPESILSYVDMWAGYTVNLKPINYSDTIEIENGTFRAVFRKGETLPYVYYDYTIPWSYPDWGNTTIPRNSYGYIIPDTDNRFLVTPNILDTRPFTVTSTQTEQSNGTLINITVASTVNQSNLALGVWNIPREYSKDPSFYVVSGAQRFIPVRAAFTQNLCGIVVANIQAGQNNISVLVTTKTRALNSLDMQLTTNIRAKVLDRDGTGVAYIYTLGSAAEPFGITVPPGVTARLYNPFVTDDLSTLTGANNITVTPGQYQKILGLTYSQMLSYVSGAQSLAP